MYKPSLREVEAIDDLAWPNVNVDLSLDSPAVEFFNDYTSVQPRVLDANGSAVKAQKLMQETHVKLKLITDTKALIGIVTIDDLSDEQIIKKVSEGYRRDEIPLTEFMTAKRNLKAIAVDEVEKSTIFDVIRSLKDYDKRHCFVLDPSTHKVRGVFSANDISKMLNLDIDAQEPLDFHRVFSAVH